MYLGIHLDMRTICHGSMLARFMSFKKLYVCDASHGRSVAKCAHPPDENRVMSTLLMSKAFLNTKQVIADRS